MNTVDQRPPSRGVPLDYEAARRLLTPSVDAEAQAQSLPGLQGYRLLGTVGSGGSGTAYLAQRGDSEELLLVKVLHRGGSPGSASQVLREWAALRRVRLDCLPRVVECGEIGGCPFLVREYVEGRTLGEAADELVDDAARARLMMAVCNAVATLHDRGLLHRDLTPANIVLRDDGGVSLIDLGLAGRDEEPCGQQTIAADGVGIGTPAYMAPEQARGDWSEVSVRSDVFALGAIGYVLFTKHPPRNPGATVVEALHHAATLPARDPRLLRPGLPVPMAAVLNKACAANGADRYPSAAALGEEFDRWLRGEPVRAVPRSRWRRAWGWLGRHPVAAAFVATTLVCAGLIGGSLGSVWWLNGQPSHVEWSNAEREARLVSRGGRVFGQVGGGSKKVDLAEFVKRPASLGGQNVWVTLAVDDRLGGIPQQVAVWDPATPGKPLWTSGDAVINVPQEFSQARATSFVVREALVADVLPETEGEPGVPEIVVAMTDVHYYPALVRVYDLAGQTRCEVWHKGWIMGMRWMPEARRLVCLAASNSSTLRSLGVTELSEAVAALGPAPTPLGERPLVLFAFEPRDGGRQVVDVPYARGTRVGPIGMMAWYKWPTPLDFWATGTVALCQSKGAGRAGTTVTLSRAAAGGDYQALIDADGRLVTEVWADLWRSKAETSGLRVNLE